MPGTHFIGTTDSQRVVFKTNNIERFTVTPTGRVGVKTANPMADFSVNGEIWAKKIKVTQTGWPDYVFDSTYKLRSLSEVSAFIKAHKHLPDVPSAKEIDSVGLNVGEGQAVLLKKIEELTLYIIKQNEVLLNQQTQIDALKKTIDELKKRVNQ